MNNAKSINWKPIATNFFVTLLASLAAVLITNYFVNKSTEKAVSKSQLPVKQPIQTTTVQSEEVKIATGATDI